MIDIAAILTIITTAASSLIVWLIQENRKAKAMKLKENGIVEKALLALIRNQLVSTYRLVVSKGNITVSQKQSMYEMHDLYTSLGGNGATSHLIESVGQFPTIRD